ncbi:hypothetical protein AAC387_Pa04g1277 [Persea americana]
MTPTKVDSYSARVRTPNKDAKGWISVQQKCKGHHPVHGKWGSKSVPPLGPEGAKILQPNSLGGEEKMITFKQEQWHADNTGRGMKAFGEFFGARDVHESHEGRSCGEEEADNMLWSPQRIVHCAKAIGVTVEGTTEGGDLLVKFVQSWDNHNGLERKGIKSTMKGVKELHNLNYSINYEKTKSKESEDNTVQDRGGKSQGGLPSFK